MMTLDAAQKVDQKAIAQKRILVVDDQSDVREALRLLLKGGGYAVETAASPGETLAAVASADFDLIILDMNFTWDTTSGEEGLRLLDQLHAHASPTQSPVISMTGWSTIELAVQAMQRGACDFIPKPWDNRRFLSVVQKHLDATPLDANRTKTRGFDSELAVARSVQQKLLPQPHFRAFGLDCQCAALPAGEIGGDLYDFFEIDPGAMAFLLGDVSGKGIPAALLVSNLQATIRAQEQLAKDPSKLMERVNYLFFESTRPEHFATLFYGVYDAASRTIRYVSCGHPSAILVRANGNFETLDATATVLGAFKNRGFDERSVTLAPGDRLVLFSDGFSDVQEDSDLSVSDTVVAAAKSHPTGLAEALASLAVQGGKQADDITVMDLRVA